MAGQCFDVGLGLLIAQPVVQPQALLKDEGSVALSGALEERSG